MFYVVGLTKEFSCHVGDKHAQDILQSMAQDGVKFIQADGHELESIENQITNLPHVVYGRVVRWYGDNARFICGNWNPCKARNVVGK